MLEQQTPSSFEEYPDFEGAEHEDSEISTLSKRGYQLLKEGRIDEAKTEFRKITTTTLWWGSATASASRTISTMR